MTMHGLRPVPLQDPLFLDPIFFFYRKKNIEVTFVHKGNVLFEEIRRCN